MFWERECHEENLIFNKWIAYERDLKILVSSYLPVYFVCLLWDTGLSNEKFPPWIVLWSSIETLKQLNFGFKVVAYFIEIHLIYGIF